MPTAKEREDAIQQLKVLVEQVADLREDAFLRKDLGEDSNFEVARPAVTGTLTLYRQLRNAGVDHLPGEAAVTLMRRTTGFLELHKEVGQVRSTNENFHHRRKQLLQQLEDAHNNNYQTIREHVVYGSKVAVDAVLEDLKAKDAERRELLAKLSDEASGTLGQMKALLAETQAAAKDAGVSGEAIHFDSEAKKFARAAWVWLALSIGWAVAVILYVVFVVERELQTLPAGASVGDIAKVAVPRVVIVALAWFGLAICIRNYTANQHNAVVNRHRANALSTFRAFVTGTADPDTKNAVLLQSTQCIFSPQLTGYLKGESDPQQSNQIIEIVRSVTGKGQG